MFLRSQFKNLPPVYITIEIYLDKKWVEVALFPLEKICILLGRNRNLKSESGDILIDDSICSSNIYSRISSVHLTFYRRSTTEKENHKYQSVVGYAVKDGYNNRSSTNGTLLNGKALTEKTNLVDGDILQIGYLRIIYHQKSDKNSISNDMKDTYTGETTEIDD